MIGWPVIGLLGGLPQAAHDGVLEVFSTEKRRGVLCYGCWPCGLRHPPRAPELDVLNKRPYFRHAWTV